MIGAIATVERGGAVEAFKPQEALASDAKADAVIAYAQKIRDWPMLEKAIEQKMDDQAEFVRWWDENVPEGGRPKTGTDLRRFTREVAETQTGIAHQQVSKWRKRLKDIPKYRATLFGAVYRKAFSGGGSPAHYEPGNKSWQGTNDWHTPAVYIEAVNEMLGGIDLDPASDSLAQKTVQATEWYGADGLSKKWGGQVFLNPPYGFSDGKSLAGEFCEKAIMGYENGDITEAILLIYSSHSQKWQAPLFDYPLCLVHHRIKFVARDGSENENPTFQNMFCYLGKNKARFREVFSRFGYIMERVNE